VASALCIGLAAGALLVPLPSGSVTLAWIHSVEKTAWEEDYAVDGELLELREARVRTSGAGMDAPPQAIWRAGWWRYRPRHDRLAEVVLANSEFVDGYSLCWGNGECRPLETWVAKGTPVRLRAVPCDPRRSAP